MIKRLIKRFITSFANALIGLVTAFRVDLSFRTHIVVTLPFLIIFTFFIKPNSYELLIMVIAFGIVLIAELLNTSIETLLNRLHPDRHQAIAASKDIAAGAVFVGYGILATVLGVILWEHVLCCLGGHV